MREVSIHVIHACAQFLDQTDEQMQPAFAVFDKDGSGKLDAAEFKLALPLMGEDVPEEKIDDIFKSTDTGGTPCETV